MVDEAVVEEWSVQRERATKSVVVWSREQEDVVVALGGARRAGA